MLCVPAVGLVVNAQQIIFRRIFGENYFPGKV